MLAPPGYAKIVSTPSRSRQATRISLPDIVGPTSARFVAGAFLLDSVVLFMRFCGFDWVAADHKKTHDRLPAVGFCRNLVIFDKRRRRRLPRRLAGQFVELCLTLAVSLSSPPPQVKPPIMSNIPVLWAHQPTH